MVTGISQQASLEDAFIMASIVLLLRIKTLDNNQNDISLDVMLDYYELKFQSDDEMMELAAKKSLINLVQQVLIECLGRSLLFDV